MVIIGDAHSEFGELFMNGKKAARAKAVSRVLIADDDPLVRAAVGVLVSHEADLEIAGEATNGEEAIAMAQQLRPELLLLDLNMPKKAGLEALRDMGDAIPGMKTILLTVAIEKRQIVEALQLGARGIVLKEAARTVLIDAIRAVMQGMYWINQQPVSDVRRVLHDLAPAVAVHSDKATLLSPKEKQIVTYIVEGCTNKDIAKSLETSEQVVKNHMGKIFDKLGVFNRLELALYALDNNMVQRH
ncbi:MAG: two component transcriptional regulator, LuxR family [Acidobacteriales bacterium]|nr:two component transcriptional regulator, LuxR family [Terriglobales bacterium]